MPRYFFHTADGALDRDTEGLDFADDSVARSEAARYAGALINDTPDLLLADGELSVQVTDDTGRTLVTIITRALDPAPPTLQ